MKEYREKLKIYCMIYRICIPILIILYILEFLSAVGVLPAFPTTVPDSIFQERWFHWIQSYTLVFIISMIRSNHRYKKALKDDRFLKEIHIRENDERGNMVVLYANSATFRMSILLGMVGSLIAGYFNKTVCITIFAFTILQSIIGYIFRSYYNRKF